MAKCPSKRSSKWSFRHQSLWSASARVCQIGRESPCWWLRQDCQVTGPSVWPCTFANPPKTLPPPKPCGETRCWSQRGSDCHEFALNSSLHGTAERPCPLKAYIFMYYIYKPASRKYDVNRALLGFSLWCNVISGISEDYPISKSCVLDADPLLQHLDSASTQLDQRHQSLESGPMSVRSWQTPSPVMPHLMNAYRTGSFQGQTPPSGESSYQAVCLPSRTGQSCQ